MRHVKSKTPHGSVVEVKQAMSGVQPYEKDGLLYLDFTLINHHGNVVVEGSRISYNAAWAIMCALQLFLPEDGAECTTRIVSDS